MDVQMSGSGPSVFGICSTWQKAELIAEELSANENFEGIRFLAVKTG